MPINYSKYPPNWLKKIRPRILERANNRCENCGLKNHSFIWSYKINGDTIWNLFKPTWISVITPKHVKVVLTIAHLDHDETNHDVTDDRLKAMCQRCHLRYDAKEKARRKSEIKNQLKLIP